MKTAAAKVLAFVFSAFAFAFAFAFAMGACQRAPVADSNLNTNLSSNAT